MKKFLSLVGLLFIVSINQSMAQGPEALSSKDISSNKKLSGTKMVYQEGWKEVSATGRASVIENALLIKCDSGEFYAFRAIPKSLLAFNPTSDFTIEFKVKVINSNGRGLDVSFKTRDFSSPTLFFSHKYVGVATPKATLVKIKENEYHTYRLAISKEEKKVFVYVDNKYVSEVSITDSQGATPSLTFGKGHKVSKSDIYLDYISYDLTGAYKP